MGDREPALTLVPETVKVRLTDYLRKQGFEVVEGAKLVGKSGVEHTFDILATRDTGLNNYRIAACIVKGGNIREETGAIFDFANKAYDVGVNDRILVAVPGLSKEAKQLAEKQRIKVVEADRTKNLLDSRTVQPAGLNEPVRFETKSQLLESLTNLGYAIQENVTVVGKSGVEYTFDILAQIEVGVVPLRQAMDFLDGSGEITLQQISLFDTKTFDVGIENKAIVVFGPLSPEALKFARHQRIKVIELGRKSHQEHEAPGEKPRAPQRLPGVDNVQGPAPKQPKLLRHAPQQKAVQLIPEMIARRYNAVPVEISGDSLRVVMANPSDIFALEAFAAHSRMRVQPVAGDVKEIIEAIDANYKGYGDIEQRLSSFAVPNGVSEEALAVAVAADTPLTQALALIIDEAVKARASDIHIEPEDDRVRVRYRIDGTLQDMMSLPLSIQRALISRIKILSDLNIADQHHPQDGQFSTESKGRSIDVRVAVTPTVWGEMAVLRLLDKSLAVMPLSDLGMLPETLAKYENMLKVAYGMILISGPTGAGKTTTLYASINSLDKMSRKIVTIEDPAEYRFKGINQIQVNNQAGITFASGLRSILRLDPDIILVGEIRDKETASIAVQAALTGHLMLSSIHASDTVGVIFRLIELGIEPFLIASSVTGVVAQRMGRRICPECARLIEVPVIEQATYERETGEKRSKFLYGSGCKTCSYTGYLGRVGFFEVLTMTDAIRSLIARQADVSELRAQAIKEGICSVMNDGMTKVKAGITTPSEALRAAYTLG